MIELVESLPEYWQSMAITVIASLIALRTTAFTVVKTLRAIDAADGKTDWPAIGRAGDALEAFDRKYLSWLPVKTPFKRDVK